MIRFILALTLTALVTPALVLCNEKTDTKQVDDATFVMKASESDMAEITLGKLAMEQASSPAVRKFAAEIIEDHKMSSAKLLRLAKTAGLSPATKLSPKCKAVMDKLTGLKGPAFDQMYMKGQLKAHEEAIALFRSEARNGQDKNLKSFATETLPVLEKHLKMVKEIAGQSSGTSGQ